jgi:transcriptional regulator with XRE-family HTH domain
VTEETLGKAIGRRLRALREEQLLSRRELAIRAGVGLATIDHVEKGISARPRRTTIEKLARPLGVSVEDLIGAPRPLAKAPVEAGASQGDEASAAPVDTGSRIVKLSDDSYSGLLEQVREGDTEALEQEAEAMEERFQQIVRDPDYDADSGFYNITLIAYAESLAALALVRGGGLEEIRDAINRALGAREAAHAGVEGNPN